MLISVIIPVYNTKEYLEKSLLSAIDEKAESYEILLVDDGSTDGESPALCDRLSREHEGLCRVIHQENRGLGGARNTGILNARGEYLLFLDSDDTLAPGTVSLLEKKIGETGADVISFAFLTVNEKGEGAPLSTNYRAFDEAFSLSEHPEFLLSLPNACGRIWRKSLFAENDILFPEKVWYEDIRTTTKLFALAKSIATLEEPLYRYLQREDSIMHSSKIQRNREILDAFDDLLSWYREKGLFEKFEKELCRLLIDHVFLAASVRVLRADPSHPLLKEFADYCKNLFPNFAKNPYLKELTRARQLAFLLLRLKQYRLLRLLFRVK